MGRRRSLGGEEEDKQAVDDMKKGTHKEDRPRPFSKEAWERVSQSKRELHVTWSNLEEAATRSEVAKSNWGWMRANEKR